MISSQHTKLFVAAWVATSLLLLSGLSRPLRAEEGPANNDPTNVTIVVKEADSGEPISQARITLQFNEPHGPTIPRKPKKIVYNAKTDSQGRCKLTGVNKGTIVLMVTATAHQSFGKEMELERDNQVIEIKLKKPQPLI